MSASVKVSDLKTRIRDVTAQDTSAPTNHFILDAFLLRRINVYGAKLHGMLCRATPDFLVREVTITAVASQKDYALPDDFYSLVSLTASDGTHYQTIPRFNLGPELAALKELDITGAASIYSYCYRVRGKVIQIRPTPTTSSHSFDLVYNPTFQPVVADGDLIDGINGWEEYIVQECAADVAQRDETDPTLHKVRAAEMRAEIEALAADRDEGMDYILDVRGDDEGALPSEQPYYWGRVI